jgi:hypothetical protein
MTQRKEKIRQEVDKTLSLLDQVDRISPSPWFQQRLQARIEGLESTPTRSGHSIWRLPWLKPALFSVILVLNLGTFWQVIGSNGSDQDSHQQYVENLASDYGMTYSDSFFGVSEAYKE